MEYGHTYKTLMVELGTPATLMDAQMSHEDGSIQARYSHITTEMILRLLDGLTCGCRKPHPPCWRPVEHRSEISSLSTL